MYSKYSFKLKEGAIFVADAHFSKNKTIFLDFLQYINNLENKPSQMIFLGDMFDLLVGQVYEHTIKYKTIIKLINNLANHIDIIYFEGNHDFNITSIFYNLTVIPLSKQPLLFKNNNINILISHGDCYGTTNYNIYSKIIRNTITIKIISLFNFNSFFINKIEQKLDKKYICKEFNITKIAKQRIKLFNTMFSPIFNKINFIVEGHLHQSGKYTFKDSNTTYIAIPSLYCSKNIVIYEKNNFIKKKFYDI